MRPRRHFGKHLSISPPVSIFSKAASNSDDTFPDENLSSSDDVRNLYQEVKFGKNVLIGKNVKIGRNSHIASNSIIESNVHIGENCVIGSFVTIRNSLISDNVYIQDGSKIGVKGFGFIPNKNINEDRGIIEDALSIDEKEYFQFSQNGIKSSHKYKLNNIVNDIIKIYKSFE